MMRCKDYNTAISNKNNGYPGCGDNAGSIAIDTRKKKSGIWGILGKALKKLIALILYLVLTVCHMVVLFVCFYGGMILSGLSVIAFIGVILGAILAGMGPETDCSWNSVFLCMVASFIFMFLPCIGYGISAGLESLREIVMDIIRD